MSWIIFSILAAITWALVNLIDKCFLVKHVKKPIILVIILSIVGAFIGPLIYFVNGFSELSYLHMFLSLFVGVFYILTTFFYFKAIMIEEISRIVPLFYLTQIFIALFAAVFLGEVFSFTKYLGIFLLILGAILISTKKISKISLGKAFWYMVFGSLSSAIADVLTKYLLNYSDYWTIFSYSRLGTFLFIAPIFFIKSKDIALLIKRPKIFGMVSFNEVLNLVGVLFVTIAASIGYITFVRALSTLNSFFVLVFTILLSIFFPKILKEEINRSTILLKAVSIVLIFIGFILII